MDALQQDDVRGSYSLAAFCRVYNVGLTFVYQQIKEKKLRAVKAGAKTLILRRDAEAWVLLCRMSEGQMTKPPKSEPPYTPIAAWSEKHRKAQSYAKNGLAVFPLTPNTKIPLAGSRGHLDATTDLNRIDMWWTENADYNIGAVPASKNCTVIDTDEKDDRKGGTHFDALCTIHTGDPAPRTKVVQTASNPPGHHRWYTGTVEWDGLASGSMILSCSIIDPGQP